MITTARTRTTLVAIGDPFPDPKTASVSCALCKYVWCVSGDEPAAVKQLVYHVHYVNVYVCQGDERAAVKQLVCHVHYRPDMTCRWVRLAQLLLSQFADTHQSHVTHCCQVAVSSSEVDVHSVCSFTLLLSLFISICLSVGRAYTVTATNRGRYGHSNENVTN